mmetsp:Transcript_9871/g.26214  ORF Transcript_9871/g.26214 Transcript_9871/m.26214 type:complete len:170 (-) Transcript_9871:45-554(-)
MQAMLLSCIALLSSMRAGALVPTDQPVLMRIVFASTTTASDVRQAIIDYPVCDLPGAPTATTEDGAQLMLWCAPPEGDAYASEVKRRSRCEIDRVPYAGGDSVPDGGMAFRISTDGAAVALEASRVVADKDELPKVIREKQLCKKMLAWLEGRVECTSSSLRPVGSGSF